jgi:hypothetical protein
LAVVQLDQVWIAGHYPFINQSAFHLAVNHFSNPSMDIWYPSTIQKYIWFPEYLWQLNDNYLFLRE